MLLNEKKSDIRKGFSPLSRTKTWAAQLWMGAISTLQKHLWGIIENVGEGIIERSSALKSGLLTFKVKFYKTGTYHSKTEPSG